MSFLVMMALLAGLAIAMYQYDGLAQRLGVGTVSVVGLPVLWLVHRQRMGQVRQLEEDYAACRACAAVL